MISVSLPARLCFQARLADIASGAKLGRHFVLAGALSLGSLVGAQAHPMDSPETVYIDGVPCNSACQSYMAWSRKTLEQNSESPRSVATRKAGKPRVTSVAPKHAAPLSPAKEVVPMPRQAPRNLTAGLEYLVPVPEDHSPAKVAIPETRTAALQTQAAAPQPKAAAPAGPDDKTIEEQILAATALADRVTAAASAVDDSSATGEHSAQADGIATGQDAGTSTRSPDRIVLILARADIQSIADLANKDIAIEDRQSGFREQIRTGIVAAGAAMVELRDGNASAIDRLVSGEQPAAVLTLASPEAADWFPEIKGFRTFRVPLSPS